MRQHASIVAGVIAALALPAAALTSFTGNTAPAGAHYNNGSAEPVCTADADSVDCTGTAIGGVGHIDADVALSVTASLTVQCQNGGGQIVEVKTNVTSSVSPNGATSLRNGTLTVSAISAGIPSTATLLSSARCPNRNWTKMPVGSPTISWRYTLTFNGFILPAILVTGP